MGTRPLHRGFDQVATDAVSAEGPNDRHAGQFDVWLLVIAIVIVIAIGIGIGIARGMNARTRVGRHKANRANCPVCFTAPRVHHPMPTPRIILVDLVLRRTPLFFNENFGAHGQCVDEHRWGVWWVWVGGCFPGRGGSWGWVKFDNGHVDCLCTK